MGRSCRIVETVRVYCSAFSLALWALNLVWRHAIRQSRANIPRAKDAHWRSLIGGMQVCNHRAVYFADSIGSLVRGLFFSVVVRALAYREAFFPRRVLQAVAVSR